MKDKNNVKLSIIIPTYNNCQILELVISSLLYQDILKKDYEIIVVDDGSSDDTKEVVQRLIQDNKNILYLWQEDKGFRAGQARNLGVKNAQGEILVFLDDDSVVPKDFLSNHLKSLNDCDVVLGYNAGYGSDETYDIDNIQKLLKDENNIDDLDIIPEFRHDIFSDKAKKDSKTNPRVWWYFVASNFSIRKEIFDRFRFDEDFIGWAEEDVELGYRLFKAGNHIKMFELCISFNLSRKKEGQISMLTKGRFISTTKNQLLFYKKHRNFEVKEYVLDRYNNAPEQFRMNTFLDLENLRFERD